MSAKTTRAVFHIDIDASTSVNLTEIEGSLTPAGLKTMDSVCFTCIGAGTLTFTPIFNGVATHTAYPLTNDSGWLDLTSVDEYKLEETGGADPIQVIVTLTRGL